MCKRVFTYLNRGQGNSLIYNTQQTSSISINVIWTLFLYILSVCFDLKLPSILMKNISYMILLSVPLNSTPRFQWSDLNELSLFAIDRWTFCCSCSTTIHEHVFKIYRRPNTKCYYSTQNKKCRNESVEYFTNPLHSKHH